MVGGQPAQCSHDIAGLYRLDELAGRLEYADLLIGAACNVWVSNNVYPKTLDVETKRKPTRYDGGVVIG